jgi:hypothetical protein
MRIDIGERQFRLARDAAIAGAAPLPAIHDEGINPEQEKPNATIKNQQVKDREEIRLENRRNRQDERTRGGPNKIPPMQFRVIHGR